METITHYETASACAVAEQEPTTGPAQSIDSTTTQLARQPDFESLVARYRAPILRYLRRIADPGDDEDLAQEVFLRLHKEISRSRSDIRNVQGFLFRVARNLALDSLRRRRTRNQTINRAAERTQQREHPEALGELSRRDAARMAIEELGRLPDTERKILSMKLFDAQSLREIGRRFGISRSTVGRHVSTGLRTIARRLAAAGVM